MKREKKSGKPELKMASQPDSPLPISTLMVLISMAELLCKERRNKSNSKQIYQATSKTFIDLFLPFSSISESVIPSTINLTPSLILRI